MLFSTVIVRLDINYPRTDSNYPAEDNSYIQGIRLLILTMITCNKYMYLCNILLNNGLIITPDL